MPPPLARATSLVFVLLATARHVGSSKWSVGAKPRATKKQVKVSFDDGSFSFWDPFKKNGSKMSTTIIPIAEEVGRRAPGYTAYAAASTGLGLFLPPKLLTAFNVAYVAAAVARSHEGGMETFCKDEGRLLLGMPSLHLAVAGTVLRTARFRLWRRLFVRATLFRLRYQLRFMRIYRPRWVTRGVSPLAVIVQDTAHAARSVQGLLPDLCHQAAFVAGGCRLPHWSECNPPPRVEKGWGVLRRLDRRLKREFGARAKRARRVGVGLLGWRIPHRVVLGAAGLIFKSPDGRRTSSAARNKQSRRKFPRVRGGQVKEEDDDDEADEGPGMAEQLVEVVQEESEQGDSVVVEEVVEEFATGLPGAADGVADEEDLEEEEASTAGGIPAEGPLVLFHNVTTIVSRGSTLTKSYRALAELPYGDGKSNPDDDASFLYFSRPKGVSAWAAADDLYADDETSEVEPPPPVRQIPTLQPVIIKRNIPRQLRLAEDDIAVARKILRRLTYRAEIDLDMSGVVAAVAEAVARTRDLRVEARSIEMVRSNLFRAGMLGSAVGVPEVVSCPELGPLARKGILVTTALRGVDVSDAYVMQHAAPSGEKERSRFVDGVFAAFGQMCLADGLFPSNPMPENLLYMYSGQVGLTDLSSVSQLTENQRRALCRLYHTLAELKREDAANPSEDAETKARAAMESVGLVIDLPPAGGIARWSSSSSSPSSGWSAEEAAALAVASAAERVIGATLGGVSPGGDGEEEENEEGRWQAEELEKGRQEEEEAHKMEALLPLPLPSLSSTRAPLTYVMLLRGLFDTRRDEALALMGGGGMELLRGMAVRRLPQAMVPVLRMVANLRGVCAHLDVDESILPRFSRAASKGLSWRKRLAASRGGGGEDGAPPRQQAAIYDLDVERATPAVVAF